MNMKEFDMTPRTGKIRRKHIREHVRRKPRDPESVEVFCRLAEAAVAEGVIFEGNKIVEILSW